MSNFWTPTEVSTLSEENCYSTVIQYLLARPSCMAAQGMSPYDWIRWRFDPGYRWDLRRSLWPLQNSGPYSTPVLCGMLEAAGVERVNDVDNLTYMRESIDGAIRIAYELDATEYGWEDAA